MLVGSLYCFAAQGLARGPVFGHRCGHLSRTAMFTALVLLLGATTTSPAFAVPSPLKGGRCCA
jgi:hypothetical protein